MDRKRQYIISRQLEDVQKLRVAHEHLRLIDAQKQVEAAELQADAQTRILAQARDDLDQLLAGDGFCPTRYRISCENLLLMQTEADNCGALLAETQRLETDQHINWHQNREQSSWLSARSGKLRRKLARIEEDKKTIETGALLTYMKGHV